MGNLARIVEQRTPPEVVLADVMAEVQKLLPRTEPIDADGAGRYVRPLPGGVPEWLKGADCKSAGVRLRWFESSPLHQV